MSLRNRWQCRLALALANLGKLVVVLGGAVATLTAFAAPADFDGAFGGGTGRVTAVPLTALQSDSVPSGTFLLPDGRIIMAGRCADLTSSVEKVCITRHLANGAPDPSLNGSGDAQFSLPTYAGEQTVDSVGAVLTSDGKVVVAFRIVNIANQSTTATLLVRFTSIGTLDGPFGFPGSPGFVRLNGVDVFDLAPLPDGRFLAMGICSFLPERRCMMRIALDGTLDTTFGNHNGYATSPLVGDVPSSALGKVLVLASGRIVVAVPCLDLLCVLGFSPNGVPDAPFSGWYISFGSTFLQHVSAAVQADGKLVFAGACGTPPSLSLCLARTYPPNPDAASSDEGNDKTFSGDGQLVSVFLGYRVSDARVTLDGNGRIVVAAQCLSTATQIASLCVFRFNTDGSLDNGFGTGGRALRQIAPLPTTSTQELPLAVMVQPDARILIGASCGWLTPSESHVFCMARLLGNAELPQCSLDFDGDGVVSREVDAVLHARVTARMSNASAMGGLVFSPAATRSKWSDIIAFLVNSCGMPTGTVPVGQCSPDIDGDGNVTLGIDSLIMTRVTAGLTQAAALNGISFPASATRKTWPDIRNFLVNQCGMTIAP